MSALLLTSNRVYSLLARLILVGVVSLVTTTASAQQELAPSGELDPSPIENEIDPAPHLPSLPLWIWVAGVILLLVLIATLLYLYLRFRKPPTPALSSAGALALARKRFEELAEITEEDSLAEVATRVSLILRHYLADSRSEKALYQTQQEFRASEDRLRALSPELREETATYLQKLAEVQYASPRSEPTAANEFVAKGAALLELIAAPYAPPLSDHV